jgi:FAD/FMN-containing dehydrogenase
MTQTMSGRIEALWAAVTGPVHVPGDAALDDARRLWNAAIDRRPSVIVGCRSAADVAAAVRFARTERLEIAVRGGAYSIPGSPRATAGW